MPTVEYRVPGATETKYIFTPRATLLEQDNGHWNTLIDCEFDYSWVPDPGDPPYIYVFGNQWWSAVKQPTIEYRVPGATETKYMPYPRAELIEDLNNWTIPENTNQAAFDFTWVPDPGSPPYIYQFATQWNRAGGPVYTVPGATEIKYATQQTARMLPTDQNWTIPTGIDINSFDFSWTPDATEQPYIYQFGTQWQKTGGPRYTVPGATEVKYITTPRANKINKDINWQIPDNVDITTFDFTWHPDATEQPYIYQFGTQHQRTGGPQYHVPGATDTKYIDQIRIKTERVATAIYEIDHMDGNSGKIPDTVKPVRYFDNYLDTLKRLAKSIPDEHEFVWICSSICDYSTFDFTWHPEIWQASMLHVFPSDGEKFGDTFFMHVPTFRYRADKLQLLDWYDLNFMDVNVPRRPLPVVRHSYDTHVEAVQTIDFAGPLAIYTTQDSTDYTVPAVSLWREKTKTIVPLSPGASSVVVPKISIPYIKEQLYDYPYIDKKQKTLGRDQLQDIIFISYDEPDADVNWAILKNQHPRAKRIHGIQGMEIAKEAAADMATTPWYFAVFAKTKVHENFNFSYAPDYMQQPKHYIFNCLNTVNNLEYGHMGIVLYNSKGIKETNAANNFGIDYTLSFLHESVPILSCYGSFDQSPYHTWRTAFRETVKLAYFESITPTVEGAYRLNVWKSKAHGPYAHWCLQGANDGVDFFNNSDRELTTLKQSFRWEWLKEYFITRHGDSE